MYTAPRFRWVEMVEMWMATMAAKKKPSIPAGRVSKPSRNQAIS